MFIAIKNSISKLVFCCKHEGIRITVLRIYIKLFKLKKYVIINKINNREKSENRKLLTFSSPDFSSIGIKKAYYNDPEGVYSFLKSYVERTLTTYGWFLRLNAAGSILDIKNAFETAFKYRLNNSSAPYHNLINFIWEYEGTTEELLNLCAYFMDSSDIYNKKYARSWLIYMSALIEKKYSNKFNDVLKLYVNHFGELLLHQYLPVAYYADKLGVTNKLIKIAASVFERLENDYSSFKYYVYDKTIAVVGSAPINTEKGTEIDKHDVVIRFNNFKIDGFEKVVGKKTTAWMRNKDPKTNPNYRLTKKIEIILLETDIWHYSLSDNYLEVLHNYADDVSIPICYLNHRAELIKKIGSFPTSGALLVYNLYLNIDKIQKLDLYGFSFQNISLNQKKDLKHYYDNKNVEFVESTMHHNIILENVFLNGLINNSKLGEQKWSK